MHRMFADMASLMAMPLPDPDRMIRSVMQGVPQVASGSGVVVTSISTGNGTCRQTITYRYPGSGGQPRVQVSSTGDACGRLGASGPIGVTQPVPMPQPRPPRHERWTIGNPPHLLRTGTPPRI